MFSFLARRLLFIFLVCFLIVFFIHLGMRMVSNSNASVPDFDLARNTSPALRESRQYLGALLSGQLGFVIGERERVSITDRLRETFINSMGLLLVSLAASAIIGLAIGSFIALTRYGRLVLPLLTVTLIGISMPSFFAAILLERGEIFYLRTFGHRLVSISGFGWDFEHMFLPILVLAARPVAYITRTTYLALSRIMEQDYIRVAYAKGLSRNATVSRHALRNLAVPVLTAVGVSLRFSLGSLPVVELFFRWPGIGLHLLRAIDSRQTELAVTLALALGLTFLISNLLLDTIYRLLDPRLQVSS